MFYKSGIQIVLTFSITCWLAYVSQKDKNNLQSIVNISSKLTDLRNKCTLITLYEKQVLWNATQIINATSHILHCLLRLRFIYCLNNVFIHNLFYYFVYVFFMNAANEVPSGIIKTYCIVLYTVFTLLQFENVVFETLSFNKIDLFHGLYNVYSKSIENWRTYT